MPRLRSRPISRETPTALRTMRRRSSADGESRMRMCLTATCTTTIAAVLVLAGCAGTGMGKQDDTEAKAAAMLKQSFVERGQAKLDRLDQDETQRLCTEAGTKAPPKDVAQKIEQLNLATIKWPVDGKYLGDWKNGEK